MACAKFIFCPSVLFTATFDITTQRTIEVLPAEESGFVPVPNASRGKIVKIVDEFPSVTLDRQEFSDFIADSSEAGFGRITRVGASGTRGASAEMKFDITMNASDAERLDSHDSSFTETLSTEEIMEYKSFKSDYNGLNIPLFRWIGANFNNRITREELDFEASTQTKHAAKAQAASELLESAVDTRIGIHNSLKATCVSFRPTVAFASSSSSESKSLMVAASSLSRTTRRTSLTPRRVATRFCRSTRKRGFPMMLASSVNPHNLNKAIMSIFAHAKANIAYIGDWLIK